MNSASLFNNTTPTAFNPPIPPHPKYHKSHRRNLAVDACYHPVLSKLDSATLGDEWAPQKHHTRTPVSLPRNKLKSL